MILEELRLTTEDSDEWLLTIYRDKGFFEIVVRGPIGGTLEFTTAEETETIREAFKSHEVYNRSSYKIYEVLRDIHRRCDIIDTTQSSLAVLLPPIWLFVPKYAFAPPKYAFVWLLALFVAEHAF